MRQPCRPNSSTSSRTSGSILLCPCHMSMRPSGRGAACNESGHTLRRTPPRHTTGSALSLETSWVALRKSCQPSHSWWRSHSSRLRKRRPVRAASDRAFRRPLCCRAASWDSMPRGTDKADTCRSVRARRRPRPSPSITAGRAAGSPGAWAKLHTSARGTPIPDRIARVT